MVLQTVTRCEWLGLLLRTLALQTVPTELVHLRVFSTVAEFAVCKSTQSCKKLVDIFFCSFVGFFPLQPGAFDECMSNLEAYRWLLESLSAR